MLKRISVKRLKENSLLSLKHKIRAGYLKLSCYPLLSQCLYHSDREQMGRHLRRLFAISGQHLCVVRPFHTLSFLWGFGTPLAFSSGSNLGARMSVATIIICILTQGWVCYVRSERRKSIGAIFMIFEEFVLCFDSLLVLQFWLEVSEDLPKTVWICRAVVLK